MKKWSRYFARLTEGQTQVQVAERVKVVDQTTIGRWRRSETKPRDPAIVAAVAEAYGANVLEAFVAAGMLTEEQAGLPPAAAKDFYALVDEDEGLSDKAKIHLKNQYGLLRAASAHDRTAGLRDKILHDPDLDEATKARLLEDIEEALSITTIYSSSATVVEHPFPRVSEASGRPDLAVAAHEEDEPIAGEQESPTEP